MKLNNDDILDKSTFSNIKEQLYLDAYIDVDNTYFVGLIKQGSTNYNMHNASKIGKGRVNISSDNYLTLTDGGLNTLGYAEQPICSNANIGNVTFSPTLFKSSYNNDTTSMGLEYLNVSAWTNLVSYGSLVKNTSSNKGQNVGNIGSIRSGNVQVRSFITNSEGTYYSNTITVSLIVPTYTLRFNGTYASWAYNNTNGTTNRTIYTENSNITIGSYFYSNAQLDDIPKVLQGFYIKDNNWYEVRPKSSTDKMEVVNSGLCQRGSYPSGDPGNDYPPPIDITGIFFYTESQFTDYYDNCVYGTTGSQKLYINPADNKVYQIWNATSNTYSNPFTGFIVINTSCQGRQYNNGTFVKNLTP